MIIRLNGRELAAIAPAAAVPGWVSGVLEWLNPYSLLEKAWKGLGIVVNMPETGIWIMSGSIVGILLIMFGANWPKKWIFWTWVVYFTLQGFFF